MLKKLFRICRVLINYFFYYKYYLFSGLFKKCINIGCGTDLKPFWINCDLHSGDKVTKLDIKNQDDLYILEKMNCNIIEAIHVIGYLSYSQGLNFFKSAFTALKENGQIILEFPDLEKIAKAIVSAKDDISTTDYIDLMRGLYACSESDSIEDKNYSEIKYVFGWSVRLISRELRTIGFSEIKVEDPLFHDAMKWRDSRIVGIK